MIMRSLKEVTEQLLNGTVSASAHLEEQLKTIKRLNPVLNALAYVAEDQARVRAGMLDNYSSAGAATAVLAGTTFSTRLSISVAGLPLSHGSQIPEPVISSSNAHLVERLIDAGASCLGKGNIAERGKSYFSENPRYGRTSHHADPALSPGGSGGGDAVAVATGMVDFALGADAGGSVRVPAGFCGIYGLCPTHGILSESGIGNQTTAIMRLLKTPGILARTLADLERVFKVLAGYDRYDSASVASAPFSRSRPPRVRVCSIMNGITPDQRILAAMDQACVRFSGIGAHIDRSPLTLLDPLIEPFVILAAQAQMLLEDTLVIRQGGTLQPDSEGPHLKVLRSRLSTELPPLSAADLLFRWHQIDEARNRMARAFDDFDFLLLPVSASLPVAHNTAAYTVDGQQLRTEQVFQFSTVVNALGLPAIAVPAGKTPEGIPICFQLVAPRFGESALFEFLQEAGF